MKMLFKNPRLWWKFEGRFYHKDLYYGIKNLIKWFKVIWEDRDYDPIYIYGILKHKLELQADGITKRDLTEGSQRKSEVIKTAVRLIDKVSNAEYDSEYIDYIEEEIDFVEIKNRPKMYTLESELLNENLDDYFKKYPLIYKRALDGEGPFVIKDSGSDFENKKSIAMNMSYINQERARKLLFKIISENIENWWD